MNRKPAVILFLITMVSFCSAEMVVIDADDTGWYDNRGFHSEANKMNTTGIDASDPDRTYIFNSFFVFSIPQNMDPILDVTLCLEATYYMSDMDPYEEFKISPVDTPIDILLSGHANDGPLPMDTSIFYDLMEGPELGVLRVTLFHYGTRGKQGPLFRCSLNEYGRQLIEDSKGTQIAIGLSIIGPEGDRNEGAGFNSMYGDPTIRTHKLQITTIPEPATFVLMLLGIVTSVRKRKRTFIPCSCVFRFN